MKLKIVLLVLLGLLTMAGTTPVYANGVPSLPHAFYGDLTINNSPAPTGTTVEARGEGVITGIDIEGNPIVTTEVGKYGSADSSVAKLIVQGDILDGTILTFYVNDVSTGQTAEWHSGEVTELDLSVTIAAPPPVAPPEPAAFSVTNLSIQPAEVEPGETVTVAVSVANTGGKSGSYTVVLKIDGVKEAEETVTIAAGSSRTVSFSVTREEADTYTVTVDGLSGSFTVVAPVVVVPPEPAAFSVSSLSVLPAEVEPGETVTIDVAVTNTGGTEGSYTVVLTIDGVKEAEETVTIAAGESQDVTFSVTREEADTYAVTVDGLSGSFTVVAPVVVPPAKPGINWALIGGIIGGVVIVAGLLYYFLVFRRRAY